MATHLRRALLRGLVVWSLMACYLGYRELLMFHPNLLGV